MNFHRTWVARDLEAEVNEFGCARIADAHNVTTATFGKLASELSKLKRCLAEREAERDHWRLTYRVEVERRDAVEAGLSALREGVERVRAVVMRWRKEAHADAIAGVGQSLTGNDREYYGAVNAALAISQCADDIDAALAWQKREDT